MTTIADSDRFEHVHVQSSQRRPRRWTNPVRLMLLAAAMIGGGFAAFQRIGTVANVGDVRTTHNLPAGFLTVGMTDHQPGFLLVSALDKKDVTIETERTIHILSGTQTRLRVETSTASWSKRLRRPVVITIDDQGNIEAGTVNWPLHTFQTLAETADCNHVSPLIKKHCGKPFLDVKARVAKWPPNTIPAQLRTFLTRH